MRILVTGSSGYIGDQLVGMLRDLGEAEVTCCDLKDGRDFANMAGSEFDAAVHLAAWVSITHSLDDPDGFLENNGFKLIPLLTKNKIGKIVFTSTGGAIYGERKVPAREEDAQWQGCVSPYSQSKYIGERIIRHLQPNHVILRLGNVYGGKDSIRREASALTHFRNDDPIVVYGGDQTRDFVHVDLVCAAILKAIYSDIIGTFNIGTGQVQTISAIAENIGKQRSVPVVYKSFREGEIKDVALDTSRARAVGLLL